MKFDLFQIKSSRPDLEKDIKLPIEMSLELAELVGIHLGDGSLYKDVGYNYTITYSGNLKKDKEYIGYISHLFLKIFNLNFKKLINPKKSSVVLRFRSKKLFYFHKMCLKLPDGVKKDLSIPLYIKDNGDFLKVFLRGLFDTDGCVTLQRDGKYNYILIKICTKHKNFAKEILNSLILLGIPSFLTTKKFAGWTGYDVVVRNKHVRTFFRIVGSKNPRNIEKFKNLCKV